MVLVCPARENVGVCSLGSLTAGKALKQADNRDTSVSVEEAPPCTWRSRGRTSFRILFALLLLFLLLLSIPLLLLAPLVFAWFWTRAFCPAELRRARPAPSGGGGSLGPGRL
ncbi:hypothetical protein EYF80_049633 [Liparis tanakae]|uniref:Uncharacterized protein n=1 Tax=Liparis tanakae TaxID=230148 RepID=A0A4Z2FH16_9TELE|nr:hypothetical protein EYF80_049633 [Liparis tanakae]